MADHAAWGQDRPLGVATAPEVLIQQKTAKQTPGSGILSETCTSGIDLIDSPANPGAAAPDLCEATDFFCIAGHPPDRNIFLLDLVSSTCQHAIFASL
jgi:hypothetical protein